MPDEDEELKKLLEEKKSGEEEIDEDTLNKIVDRMSDKYEKEGVLEEGEAPEKTEELRKLMRGEKTYEVGESSARQLSGFDNAVVRFFGKLYTSLGTPIEKFETSLENSLGRGLEKKLNAARMDYSVEQYLALTIISMIITSAATFGALFILFLMGILPIFIPIIGSISALLLVLGLALIIPRNKAKKIGNEVEKEMTLPHRHMSIEIRGGVGIYYTILSIASSDYGILSKGVEWILGNIEKGVSTEDALEAWSERTESENVRRVVSHIVRALRTGGNLSDVMIEIADDVSFQRRQKIADFSEKLNLVGLFLMMSAIVFPIMIAILTTIGSTPQIQKYLGFFAIFSPQFLMLVFFVIVPGLLFIFMYYIKSSDPGAV